MVTTEALEWARDKIQMGAERRSAVISKETAKLTAYHEGGHAIVVSSGDRSAVYAHRYNHSNVFDMASMEMVEMRCCRAVFSLFLCPERFSKHGFAESGAPVRRIQPCVSASTLV